MRRALGTTILVLVGLTGCKKQSALETVSADLPEGERPLEPNEVRAHVMRENAKNQRGRRSKPGANQVAPPGQGEAHDDDPPSRPADPSPSTGVTDQDGAWVGDLAHFDGAFILLKGRVDFDDKGGLTAGGKQVLDEVATLLRERSAVTLVEVQAHVHAKTKGDTKAMTQARADTVRNYLAGAGVESTRLGAVGYGTDMPIDTNRTEEGRRANTRVDLVVKTLNGASTGN